jgi:hypothetical protein
MFQHQGSVLPKQVRGLFDGLWVNGLLPVGRKADMSL